MHKIATIIKYEINILSRLENRKKKMLYAQILDFSIYAQNGY